MIETSFTALVTGLSLEQGPAPSAGEIGLRYQRGEARRDVARARNDLAPLSRHEGWTDFRLKTTTR